MVWMLHRVEALDFSDNVDLVFVGIGKLEVITEPGGNRHSTVVVDGQAHPLRLWVVHIPNRGRRTDLLDWVASGEGLVVDAELVDVLEVWLLDVLRPVTPVVVRIGILPRRRLTAL